VNHFVHFKSYRMNIIIIIIEVIYNLVKREKINFWILTTFFDKNVAPGFRLS